MMVSTSLQRQLKLRQIILEEFLNERCSIAFNEELKRIDALHEKMKKNKMLLEEKMLLNEWGWEDWGHLGLDMLGLIPGIGAVADITNALWYCTEGEYLMGALSIVAMVPVVGDAVGLAGRAAMKLGDGTVVWLAKLLKNHWGSVYNTLKGFRSHQKAGPFVNVMITSLRSFMERSLMAHRGSGGVLSPIKTSKDMAKILAVEPIKKVSKKAVGEEVLEKIGAGARKGAKKAAKKYREKMVRQGVPVNSPQFKKKMKKFKEKKFKDYYRPALKAAKKKYAKKMKFQRAEITPTGPSIKPFRAGDWFADLAQPFSRAQKGTLPVDPTLLQRRPGLRWLRGRAGTPATLSQFGRAALDRQLTRKAVDWGPYSWVTPDVPGLRHPGESFEDTRKRLSGYIPGQSEEEIKQRGTQKERLRAQWKNLTSEERSKKWWSWSPEKRERFCAITELPCD